MVVLVIIGILIAIAVPSYFGIIGTAKKTAAESNVRSALPAAQDYFVNNSDSFTGLDGAALRQDAPGVSVNAKAVALDNGTAYCVEDQEGGNGGPVYDYIGGDPTQPPGVTITAGSAAATIQPGTCLSVAGTAAS